MKTTFNLFDLTIQKEVVRRDEILNQIFTFVYKNIQCEINVWGGKVRNSVNTYKGFCEVFNHCSYIIITKEQLDKLMGNIEYGYPQIFSNNEVTCFNTTENGYKIGMDYMHCNHNADNVDLLTVLVDLMNEVDLITKQLENKS